MLRDALESVSPLGGRRYEICDLGCGTGLVGVMFQDVASRLIGIDLSAEMLKGAEAKKLYEKLYQADMVEALRAMDRRFDLALAGDVVIYLGDLGPLCQAVHDALKPGGLFAFTTETHGSCER